MNDRICFALLLALTLAACGRQEDTAESQVEAAGPAAEEAAGEPVRGFANVDGARIIAADQEPGNWLAYGRTYDEQRFSPLKQINDRNVGEMGLAWYHDTRVNRGLEASPIIVDGVMYTTGVWSVVLALDAATGELLWRYDPEVPREWGFNLCCDAVNRGVAVWKSRVFVGTIDGRLIALDAASGEPVWKVRTTPTDKPYSITGAPRVFNDKVVIGNGGAEYGVRGYVTAYDTNTGEQVWRFYTVPGDPSKPFESEAMERAAETWSGGKWWEIGGGGTVWDSMTYDPELNMLYIGVGNGSPWSRYVRSPGGGDNLFLSSIVAVNADTGEYIWHYQTTPGDSFDYTATQHMILADIEIGGETRQVIMQAPKNGFFYVLDRKTGEFLSANNFAPITWATHVDPETGRPVENPEVADYSETGKLITPAPFGAHSWQPMSFNPQTGLVYIPVNNLSFFYENDPDFEPERGWNTGIVEPILPDDPEEFAAVRAESSGRLTAWDPVTQQEVWGVPYGAPGNGGILSTAGNLVIQGTADRRLVAYSADKGELLWDHDAQTGVMAPPVTYSVGGEQYIAVMTGWGGGMSLTGGGAMKAAGQRTVSRIQVFKLGGELQLPPVAERDPVAAPPEQEILDEMVDKGRVLYAANCQVCHGMGAVGGGTLPDLRFMSEDTHKTFMGIVLGGLLKDKGMVSFQGMLDVIEVQAIHQFLIMRARMIAEAQAETGGQETL